MMASTFDRVREIVAEILGVTTSKITEDTRFADLGWNSLDAVEMVLGLEEEFDLNIPDDAAETICTVGEAARRIDELPPPSERKVL